EREADLLRERIETGRSHQLDSAFVTSIFHQILRQSVRIQSLGESERAPVMRVGLLDAELGLSRVAALRHLGPIADEILFEESLSSRALVEQVERGDAEVAVVPIEESGAGSSPPADELLLLTRLHIIGEEIVEQSFCLASATTPTLQPQPLHTIKRV